MVRWWLYLLAVFVLPLLSMVCSGQVREVRRDLDVINTGRPLHVAIWYPEGVCSSGTKALCLDESAVTHKVVVISHGSMGASDNYAWIGSGLASKGYIVVGLNHFGESRVYGEQTQNFFVTGMVWERAQDASRALDALTKLNIFQKKVAWDNAIVIGHSAGGQTAALLAGARFDLQAFAEYCVSRLAGGDRSCFYAQNIKRAPSSYISLFNGNYRDPRVRKIVLLDPALGPALVKQSMAGSDIPALVVGALHDDFLPWSHHGARYATAIPGAKTLLLEGNEGHFVFLSVCHYNAEVNGIPLCIDKAGVNRRAVHEGLLSRLVAFVGPDDEIPLSGERKAPSVDDVPFAPLTVLEILSHSPPWVFGLLIALCVLGLMQTRTRQVRFSLALLLPIGMLMLSMEGVFQYTDYWGAGLGFWLAGLVAVSKIVSRFMEPNIVTRIKNSDRLIMRGSWLPLLVILGIFITRYLLGVAQALQFRALDHWPLQMLVAGGLGAWSGYFACRARRCWRASRS
ncbi:putative dienelactone hydrolase [Pseudomonas duriflava]|uniref:Putative dienelactone hydrolase n=2 Tax=Pseudomonas duriflava TaxID=459528 RepID=A0A562PX38_9PSED|nr:putative dienelactone hydrolase [Pseudomonas duriflava]